MGEDSRPPAVSVITSQPGITLPTSRQLPAFLEPQTLISNLCAGLPQLPPHIYASLHALTSATHPLLQPAMGAAPPASGSMDELTRALVDQLVKERRLYRCDHCNILFPEMSLYIFHRGCHGQDSPFQCHFCLQIFKEKFEFMAHFMYCVHSKK